MFMKTSTKIVKFMGLVSCSPPPPPPIKHIFLTIRVTVIRISDKGFGLKKNFKMQKMTPWTSQSSGYSVQVYDNACRPLVFEIKIYQTTWCKYVIYSSITRLITNLRLAYYTVADKQT